MAMLRVLEPCWDELLRHCDSGPGEHFAFLRARISTSGPTTILIAHSLEIVPDDEVQVDETGWQVSLEAILRAFNGVVGSEECLIEVHNHPGGDPRFSMLDREQLPEMIEFSFRSRPGFPYAAMVIAGRRAFGEVFHPDGSQEELRRITVSGSVPRSVSIEGDSLVPYTFDRQLPWFTAEGQQQLSRIQVGIVGLGGTGSHIAQLLAYLGIRQFVLVDPDRVEKTNLNRVVTARDCDVGNLKVEVARRNIRSIAPDAVVQIHAEDLRSAVGYLLQTDILFGCVDNDGARLVLNELALAYSLPYFDIATGIEVEDARVIRAGGRVAIVSPDGPCLHCMNEIDLVEANYFLAGPEQQESARSRGYVDGFDIAAPSVVSLNGATANVAINEFALALSRLRAVASFVELDLLSPLGAGGQQLITRITPRKAECTECSKAGHSDSSGIERYAEMTR